MKTILIVEDNPTNLKLIRDILVFQKYNVLESTDGKAAIETVANNSQNLDLILMDLQLPEISGLEVIKKLKSDEATQNIPIIVISAHAMEADIKKCFDAGCIDYITKPVNIQEFIRKIKLFFEE